MSSFLERLGRWCARHPWRTIGAWVLVAIVVGGLAASAEGLQRELHDPGHREPARDGPPEGRFPAQAGATAQVVLHSTNGTLTDPTNAAAIDAPRSRTSRACPA